MPDGTDWDGMMYYNNDVEKGSVLLFRENGAGEDSKVIKLKGLDKNAYYDLEFQDETKLNCTMKGSDLMNEGVLVTGMTDRFVLKLFGSQSRPRRRPSTSLWKWPLKMKRITTA